MAHFTGIEAGLQPLRDAIVKFEKEAVEEVKKAAVVVQESFFSFTPVWEGETIRNYAWGVNGAPSNAHKSPIGTGEPGPTNRMKMGDEPRRGENQEAVMSELRSLLTFTRLVDLRLTNNSTIWDLVDNGSAPTSDRARNPGGVSKNAIARARGQLKNWK
jgi:hypothetical protein